MCAKDAANLARANEAPQNTNSPNTLSSKLYIAYSSSVRLSTSSVNFDSAALAAVAESLAVSAIESAAGPAIGRTLPWS